MKSQVCPNWTWAALRLDTLAAEDVCTRPLTTQSDPFPFPEMDPEGATIFDSMFSFLWEVSFPSGQATSIYWFESALKLAT
jgi:hypothetical protein